MEWMQKLESTVSDIYKNVPHLPKSGRDWLAANIWWIILVGVVLGVISIFNILGALSLGAGVLAMYGGVAGAAVGGTLLIGTIVTLSFSALVIILSAMAVQPLKAHKKKGWDQMFLIMVVGAASLVLGLLVSFNFFSFVWGAICLAIGAYFLYEIKSYFVAVHHKRAAAKKVA